VSKTTKEKQSEVAKQSWKDPEIRARRSAAIRAAFTPERREESRRAMLRLNKDPDFVAKKKATYSDPVRNQKLSDLQTAHYADPENRKKHSELMKVVNNRPELKERRRQTIIRVFSDPVIRKKLSDQGKRQWADPIWRATGGELVAAGRRKLNWDGFHNRGFPKVADAVRERDRHTCWLCWRQWENGKGRRYSAHHVNGNPRDDRMENLVTLCTSCHGNVGGRKKEKQYRETLEHLMFIDRTVECAVSGTIVGVHS